MDHILALNTAEGLLQFVIVRVEASGPVTLTAQSWHAPSQGAELLAPAIESALHRLHIAAAQLTRICVVRGPGSFTGVRLAIATASGLCRATGALCAGLDYLPLLAHSAAGQLACGQTNSPLVLWTLTHARRNLLHVQGFLANHDEGAGLPAIQPLTDIAVCSPEQSAELISEHSPAGSAACLLGSGVSKNRDALFAALAQTGESGSPTQAGKTALPLRLLPEAFSHPTAAALAALAVSARYAKQDIEPLYVRASDAEENLGNIAQSLHLDPLEALQRMDELAHHIPENPAE